jgi:hypothetical protein
MEGMGLSGGRIPALISAQEVANFSCKAQVPYKKIASGPGEGKEWKKPGLKYTSTVTIDASVDPPEITQEYKLP